jgi:hypothetical protein
MSPKNYRTPEVCHTDYRIPEECRTKAAKRTPEEMVACCREEEKRRQEVKCKAVG